MDIANFVNNYRNHPVLFIGTGISLRYLENAYTWDGLLKYISTELKNNTEYYLDIKAKCENNGVYEFDKIAALLETEFNEILMQNRNGKFKTVNDEFYKRMENGINLSRLKIYVANLLKPLKFKETMQIEIAEFKKIRKNISSIITTNYDLLIEKIFEFQPLIGNDILLSNPYGSVYKIHGCVNQPAKIIITKDDYVKFSQKYELIRAQLLSLFIHNPIIFMGYGIGDENIKSILKTIFTYIEPNSEEAKKIRENFLLVEYEKDSTSHTIYEHDIVLEGFSTIRINKIKTDDFIEIYQSISKLILPISAMDVRKVQSIVKEIYTGGRIQVKITEDLENLNNSDKIIAIGSIKTIQYQYQTSAEMMTNYFNIIEESNTQLLTLVNKHKIHGQQYFPIFGFNLICNTIDKAEQLKEQQVTKLGKATTIVSEHTTIQAINEDDDIPPSGKISAILWSILNGKLNLDDVEKFLREYEDKNKTDYRKLLCAYDYKKYGGND
ncbi:MAG: SIR2 family protein [Ignavibacteria bacterium]|nr:SIR2 family protein [Ignavibacteria bacterium]